MNLTCRLIWNTDPATERNETVDLPIAPLACLFILPLYAPGAWAEPTPTELPSGAQVSAGQASIAVNGSHMDVKQSSQNAAINWQTFNIGQDAQVDFHQPDASAVAVNRIADTNGSQIMGKLNANGQVYLINPNGVLFGKGSQVNVGGLVASTLDAADNSADDRRTFTAAGGNGKIVNQGTLNAENGYIALLGGQVSNQGVIQAKLGTVALAAGDKITLEFSGDKLIDVEVDKGALQTLAENKQLIQADGGIVLMTAKAADALLSGLVNNEGVIEARTVEEHNGVIKLLGDMDSGTVNVGGTLDASAPSIPLPEEEGSQTLNTTVDLSSAKPSPEGEGAHSLKSTALSQTLPSPSGRGAGGEGEANGGFIETSAAHVKVADGAKITTKAENGKNGTWLIDPVDFTIASGSAGLTTSGIGASTLATSLNGGNVSIATDASTAGNGDIFVNSAVSWSANKLTLTAHRNIAINANLNGSGTASLALEYGQGAVAAGNTSNYTLNNGAKVNLPAGNNFSTKLGSDGGTTTWTVITSLGAAGSVTTTDLQGMDGNRAGNYVLGADIDAAATSTWNGGTGFTPVGFNALCNVGNCFTGKFDGLGHTIGNLSMNHDTIDPVGLFGNTENAVLQNVGLLNVNLYGGSGSTGALAGRISGTTAVRNSYADGGSVRSRSSRVGGLVGAVALSTSGISYSYANVSVESSDGGGVPNASAGGLVGTNNGSISYSYATGSVTGNAADPAHNVGIGGLVGLQTANGSIGNSYATGAVSAVGGGSDLGGLIGQANGTGGSVASSYWDKTTTGQENTANVTGGGGGDGTGLDTDQWSTLGPFGTTPSDGAWSTADWGSGNPYPGVKALPYITITANASQTYGSAATFGIASILDQNGADASGLVNTGGLVWQADTTAASPVGTTSAVRGSGATGTGYQILYAGNLTVAAAPVYVYVPPSVSGGLTGTVSKFYDGTAEALLTPENFLLSGFIGNDGATIIKTTGTYASANAGSGIPVTVTLDLADFAPVGSTNLANYRLPSSLTGAVGVIDKAPLTITAGNAGKIYDGQAFSGGNAVNYSGFVNNETAAVLDGFLSYSGTYRDAVDAGSYTITPSGLTASNYALSFADGTLLIEPAPIAGSLTGTVAKTYDGTASATLAPENFLLSGFIGSDGATVTKTGARYDSPNAGDGLQVTAELFPADYAPSGNTRLSNYRLPSTLTGAIGVIDKIPLTISAQNAVKTYDGKPYKADASINYSGFVNNETAAVLDGALTYSGPAEGAIHAGSYAIVPSGLSSLNYALNFVGGTLTVNPAPITGSLTGIVSKVYDGTTSAALTPANFLLSGFIGSDSAVAIRTGSAYYADANAGSGIQVTANLASSDYAAGGATRLANYRLPTSLTGTVGVIDKAPLKITANNADKTYDGLAYSGGNGVSYAGLASGESPDSLGGSLTFSGNSQGAVNAGSYSIVPSGLSSSNYAISFASGSLAIKPAELTVTALDASKTYDGLAYSGGNGVDYSGFVNGENATVLGGSLVYGGNSQGAVNAGSYSIVPSGLSSPNYALNFVDGTLAVSPATLTVTALDASKTYDGLAWNGGNGVDYSGFVNGEKPDSLGGSLVFSGSSQGAVNAGSYSIVPAGLSSSNYAINYVPAGLSVAPATLTYTAAPSRFFNGQTPSGLSGTVNGFVAGDSLENSTAGSLLWTTDAVTTSRPGQYAISGGGLTLTNGNYVLVQAVDNADALTLQPGRPSEPVLNTLAQLEANILAAPAGGQSGTSVSFTQDAGSGADDSLSAGFESGTLLKSHQVTMNIGSSGSTLELIAPGVKLPDNRIGEDEDQ